MANFLSWEGFRSAPNPKKLYYILQEKLVMMWIISIQMNKLLEAARNKRKKQKEIIVKKEIRLEGELLQWLTPLLPNTSSTQVKISMQKSKQLARTCVKWFSPLQTSQHQLSFPLYFSLPLSFLTSTHAGFGHGNINAWLISSLSLLLIIVQTQEWHSKSIFL